MTEAEATVRNGSGTAMIFVRTYTMELILLALVLLLVFTAPGLASLANILNLLRTVAMLGIIAFGMTAVIIAGEIDLRGAANRITGGYLFGIPFPVYLFVATFIGMHFLMNRTSFGRTVHAVGGNMEAARLSGVDVWKAKSLTLALTGVLTAVSGTGTTATGIKLDLIAAVIIGGTSGLVARAGSGALSWT